MSEPRVSSGVLSNYLKFAVVAGVAFFLSPFLVHRLGDFDYGLWSLTLSTVTYFSLLDLGVNSGVVRFVARHSALADRSGLSRTIGTSHLFFLVAAAAIVVLTVAGSALLPVFFDFPAEALGKARACFLLAGFDLAANFCFAVWNASLVGLQRFAASNAWTLSIFVVKTALLVLLVRAGFGVQTVALLAVIETVIRGLGQRVLVGRFLPGVHASIGSASRETFREIASYGVWVFVIAASIKVIGPTDLVVVKKFLSTEDVTRYDMGSKFVAPLYELLWVGVLVLTPLSAKLDASGDRPKLHGLYLLTTKAAIVLALPLVFFFVVAGRDFLRVWVGEPYVAPGYPVLALLISSQLVAIAQQPGVAILKGTGHVRTMALLYLGEAVANLILSVVLVRRFGLVGVALGTVFPLLLSNGLLLPLHACRANGLAFGSYVRHAVFPALLPALPAFVLGAATVRALGPLQSWGSLLAVLGGATLLFWLPAAAFTLSRSERRALLEGVRRALRAGPSREPVP